MSIGIRSTSTRKSCRHLAQTTRKAMRMRGISIPAEEFAKAFAGETASNPYIQRWIEKIRSSRGAIVPGLEAISAFCEADATNNGLTIFFGKQGKVVSSPTRAQTADRVYNIGGYQEIIETYGLGLYVPK